MEEKLKNSSCKIVQNTFDWLTRRREANRDSYLAQFRKNTQLLETKKQLLIDEACKNKNSADTRSQLYTAMLYSD
jgi:hypothetical protein